MRRIEKNNLVLLKKLQLDADERQSQRLLKKGIWLYFILLIFEGALRRWILPELATPLLVIRDPLAIWLILLASKKGFLHFNFYIIGMGLIGIAGIITAVLVGHGSLLIALYGARIMLLHFPLIFLIGNVFMKKDVIKIGTITLWIAIPMTILTAIQFYSPQSAWVNRGTGGDINGAGLTGALDYFAAGNFFFYEWQYAIFWFSFDIYFVFLVQR